MAVLTEFDLIKTYFKHSDNKRADVIVGLGDDAAILKIPENQQLVVSIDTLVSGVHFFSDANPYDIGYKSLAVNLSDLAAMGAEPAWVTLALTLPEANPTWLAEFSRGFFSLIEKYQLQLIGGDTTRGLLSITVQVHGFVPSGKALLRSGAKPGDKIYVSGSLGDAGYALQLLKAAKSNISLTLLQRLLQPEPRLELGLLLRDVASAAIDVSDGLIADLGHILTNSQVGATVWVDELPLSSSLLSHMNLESALPYALAAGDDYELCFCVSPEYEKQVQQIAVQANCTCTCVGVIEVNLGLRLLHNDYSSYQLVQHGFQHF